VFAGADVETLERWRGVSATVKRLNVQLRDCGAIASYGASLPR
jgi:hypothetical protein